MIPKSLNSSISEVLWNYSSENALNFKTKTEPKSSSAVVSTPEAQPSSSQEAHVPNEQVVSENIQTSSNDRAAKTEIPTDRSSWFANLPRNFDLSRISHHVFYRNEPAHVTPHIEQLATQAQTTFSVADHYVETHVILPMYKQQIADMLLHSAIAKSAYRGHDDLMLSAERLLKNNSTLERTTWQPIELPEGLEQRLHLEKLDENRYLHNDSHLVVLFLINQEQKKIVISFGGTSSGKNTGRLIYRLVSNASTTFNQWKRNFHSAGFHLLKEDVPDCYVKAAEIAEKIQQFISEEPRYAGYKLTMTGHSKGGAEAAYATLKHPTIPAYCFATPPLGKRVLGTIPPANIVLAKENIHHFFVKHDVIPSINSTLKPILETSHVGKGHWLPAPGHIVSGPFFALWAHVSFHECITNHADLHFHNATDPVVQLEIDPNEEEETDSTVQNERAVINEDNFDAQLFKMQARYLG